MKKLRWGILGAGNIANQFVAGLYSSSKHMPYAVASRSKDKAQSYSEKWNLEKFYSSYEDLVQDKDVDIIYLATPNSLHFEHAKLCLENNKHILVEKPFTLSSEEAKEVFELAKTKNLFCMEAMWTRFNPLITEVKRLISEDKIGTIVSFSAELGMSQPYDAKSRLYDPKLGGGSLYDLGVYPLSLIQFFAGGKWSAVSSTRKSSSGVDIHLCAQLYNHKAQQAQIMSSLIVDTDSSFRIYGSKACIEILGPIYRPYEYNIKHYAQYSELDKQPEECQHKSDKMYFLQRKFPVLTTLKQRIQQLKNRLFSTNNYIPYRSNAYQYQADEAYKVIAENKIESEIMSARDTIETLKLMEAILANTKVVG